MVVGYNNLKDFEKEGYFILNNVYTPNEIDNILLYLEEEGVEKQFGIRAFLIKYPALINKIFTPSLKAIIQSIAPNCTKAIKSLYFDKPPNANWIVNWHQDLTINLANRKDTLGYKNWRTKGNRTTVQPATELLENIFTIRIHLDDCTKENGALRVIESSHKKGIINTREWLDKKEGIEQICEVRKGGILLMKPLLLHASKRTENEQNRRVIHIEFSDQSLPNGLQWNESVSW